MKAQCELMRMMEELVKEGMTGNKTTTKISKMMETLQQIKQKQINEALEDALDAVSEKLYIFEGNDPEKFLACYENEMRMRHIPEDRMIAEFERLADYDLMDQVRDLANTYKRWDDFSAALIQVSCLEAHNLEIVQKQEECKSKMCIPKAVMMHIEAIIDSCLKDKHVSTMDDASIADIVCSKLGMDSSSLVFLQNINPPSTQISKLLGKDEIFSNKPHGYNLVEMEDEVDIQVSLNAPHDKQDELMNMAKSLDTGEDASKQEGSAEMLEEKNATRNKPKACEAMRINPQINDAYEDKHACFSCVFARDSKVQDAKISSHEDMQDSMIASTTDGANFEDSLEDEDAIIDAFLCELKDDSIYGKELCEPIKDVCYEVWTGLEGVPESLQFRDDPLKTLDACKSIEGEETYEDFINSFTCAFEEIKGLQEVDCKAHLESIQLHKGNEAGGGEKTKTKASQAIVGKQGFQWGFLKVLDQSTGYIWGWIFLLQLIIRWLYFLFVDFKLPFDPGDSVELNKHVLGRESQYQWQILQTMFDTRRICLVFDPGIVGFYHGHLVLFLTGLDDVPFDSGGLDDVSYDLRGVPFGTYRRLCRFGGGECRDVKHPCSEK